MEMGAIQIQDSKKAYEILSTISKGVNEPEKIQRLLNLTNNQFSTHMAAIKKEKLVRSIRKNEGDKRERVYELDTKGFLTKYIEWANQRKNLNPDQINQLWTNTLMHNQLEYFLHNGMRTTQVKTLREAFSVFSAYFITIEKQNQENKTIVALVATIAFASAELPEIQKYFHGLLQPTD